jgi:hypothetical protein
MKEELEEVLRQCAALCVGSVEFVEDSEGCSFTPEAPKNNPGKYRVDREGDPPMSWG